MVFDLNSSKPLIVYPVRWTYTVIGKEEDALRAAIATVMLSRKHDVQFSKHSEHATYCSLHVQTVVENETDRDTLFHALKNHPAVRMVL